MYCLLYYHCLSFCECCIDPPDSISHGVSYLVSNTDILKFFSTQIIYCLLYYHCLSFCECCIDPPGSISHGVSYLVSNTDILEFFSTQIIYFIIFAPLLQNSKHENVLKQKVTQTGIIQVVLMQETSEEIASI